MSRRRDHIAEVHEAEAVLDDVATTVGRLRADARAALGVAGDGDGDIGRLAPSLRASGVGIYPLSALGVLAIVDTFQGYAFTVLTPEISSALGISVGTVALLVTVKTLALAVSPLPIAALAQRLSRRAAICVATAVVWGVATLYTGFATTVAILAVVLVVDGLTTGSTQALHGPMLVDYYPPPVRVRVLSAYRGMDSIGNVLAPVLVAVLAGPLGFTWRGVFLIMGALCLLAVPYCLRLRDPQIGRWDTDAVRATIAAPRGDDLAGDDVALGFFEIVRRVSLIPTVRSLLLGFAVFGMLLIPFQTFLSFYLDEELGFGPGARGMFFAATAASSIVALALYGRIGESLFRRDPGLVVRSASLALAAGVALICIAVTLPWTPAVVALFLAAGALVALLGPALSVAVFSVVPPPMRPHVAALQFIFLGGVGGVAGALLLNGVESRYGLVVALASLAFPGILGSLLLARAGTLVQGDLDRMVDEILEDEQLRAVTAAGKHVPMLSCKGIDFSYGQLQVLFGVDFTVDDGEMVALLGTNGAGKSTLLRVISGLGLPQRGTVRYRGQDITYLDAERRARLGITQIPGGRAVFGPLTVTENLRSYGYALGEQRKRLDSLIDDAFAAFPRLGERRNSLASQLSGGEQQMLGVAKALIMRPRLLVIDELSLGLAPIIVGQLLDMVRAINATGTAVVLVEQSVNIALGLVEHAYFMERGEMRFDGAAADLLARDDLLRAVFLEGAGGR